MMSDVLTQVGQREEIGMMVHNAARNKAPYIQWHKSKKEAEFIFSQPLLLLDQGTIRFRRHFRHSRQNSSIF